MGHDGNQTCSHSNPSTRELASKSPGWQENDSKSVYLVFDGIINYFVLINLHLVILYKFLPNYKDVILCYAKTIEVNNLGGSVKNSF